MSRSPRSGGARRVSGQLVEVVGQLDLTAKRPERLGDGAAALQRDELGDGAAGALNDDFLAARGEIDQAGELTLGLMHSDADHGRTVAGTWLERARLARLGAQASALVAADELGGLEHVSLERPLELPATDTRL